MSAPWDLDLALGLLDHQIVDRDGANCGKVDDVELAGLDGDEPTVVALLAGPGAWPSRSWAGRIAARLGRGGLVRVPWERVDSVTSVVTLACRADEVGLGRGEGPAARLIRWIPGS